MLAVLFQELGRKLNNELQEIELDIKTDDLLPTLQEVDDITGVYSDLLQDVDKEAQAFLDKLVRAFLSSIF